MTAPLAVVADIGGTNTRVALVRGGAVDTGSIRRFRNSEQSGIVGVLQTYLSEAGVQVGAACVAMAGPVRDGVGTLTNLAWRVDRAEIGAAIGAETVAVLNDLQAQGHALAHLGAGSLTELRPGQPAATNAARLVVGVGTGLNAALVYRTEAQTLVPPSESGHVNLPVQDEADLRLLRFLSRGHGLAGAEEALSGRGIENLYAWLCHEDGILPTGMEAAAIMAACASGADSRAVRAVELFIRLLGRSIGNLALIQLPFGGIYLCGGVARAMAPHFGAMGFEAAFLDKGRFSEFLAQFPIRLITDDYAALTGSAAHLSELGARNL